MTLTFQQFHLSIGHSERPAAPLDLSSVESFVAAHLKDAIVRTDFPEKVYEIGKSRIEQFLCREASITSVVNSLELQSGALKENARHNIACTWCQAGGERAISSFYFLLSFVMIFL
jgi:hypothetical protein